MPLELDRVYKKDCLKGLAELEAGSVDLAFADPPFNIGYEYDVYDDRKGYNEYLEWTRAWTAAVTRVLRPEGTFWVAIGDEYAAEMKLILQNDCGLYCRNWVIWYYTFGVHCTTKFTRSHAHLLYFVKPDARGKRPKKFTFHADAIRVPSARQLVYADRRAEPKGRLPDDTWFVPSDEATKRRSDEGTEETSPLSKGGQRGVGVDPQSNGHNRLLRRRPRLVAADSNPQSAGPSDEATKRRSHEGNGAAAPTKDGFLLRPQDVPGGFGPDGDTWYFSRVAGTFKERRGWHGCQMPEQLLARIIRACSDAGEVVLDPFAGSGTTPAVAKKLGRRFVGFDISAKYVKEVTRRLAAIREGDPINGPPDPLTSAPPTAEGKVRVGGRRVRAQTRAIAAPLFDLAVGVAKR